MARRYRNRRIGEFLKELDLTEGRCTGIPKIREAMRRNGSPPPRFSTDEQRTYFLVELAVHPELPGVKAFEGVQDGVHDLGEAERRILAELNGPPKTTLELLESLGYSGRSRSFRNALTRMQKAGLIGLTLPDKPNSRNQKRRLTEAGRQWLAENGHV